MKLHEKAMPDNNLWEWGGGGGGGGGGGCTFVATLADRGQIGQMDCHLDKLATRSWPASSVGKFLASCQTSWP